MKQTKAEILAGVSKEYTSAKIIDNNTLRINYADGSVAVRLHNTDIITTLPNGNIVLDAGGWQTVTTKDIMNKYAPVRIYQDKGVWYLGDSSFYNGMVLAPDGTPIKPKQANMLKINKMKKRISKFVGQLTKDNLPLPSAGDCWGCSMHTADGKTMMNGSCLEGHLKENYLHGSLLVNAMREKGYQDMQIGVHYSMKLVNTFKRALRSYLQKRLIQNIAVR